MRIAFGPVVFAAVFMLPSIAVSEEAYPDQLAAAGWKWAIETGFDAITDSPVATISAHEPLNQTNWTLLFKCQRGNLFLALQSPNEVDPGVDRARTPLT
jgi:hypothetical protein